MPKSPAKATPPAAPQWPKVKPSLLICFPLKSGGFAPSALQKALVGIERDHEGRPFEYDADHTYDVLKIQRVLQREAEDLNALREKLVRKHTVAPASESAEDKAVASGNALPAGKLDMPAFMAELNKVLDTEREIPGLLRIKRARLNLYDRENNPEGNRLTASQLLALGPLLED
jgi:hypothetical protein